VAIARQLRLRNLGGIIIIDFIDMEEEEHRRQVLQALEKALAKDHAKTHLSAVSPLGLVEMTRKRTRENLVQMLCEPCAYCEGKGYVLTPESVAHKVLREIRKDLPRFGGRRVIVTVHRSVAEQLMTHERGSLQALERELGREVEIRARVELHQEQFEIVSAGEGEPVSLPLPWLADRKSERQQRKETPWAAEAAGTTTLPSAKAPERPAEVAAGAADLPVERPRGEYLSMSLLDDEEEAGPAEPERAVSRAEVAEQDPQLVDGQDESPILPRFREQEEGV
jgi:hypothetical protein